MAFFSVIMPVYNKVATLSDALKYLYLQTFRDFEIIAVDNGSTDGSLQILREHEQAGLIRLFQRSLPGLKGYATYNFGANKSTAHWLVFFDADSILLFDHLSCFAAAISRCPDLELFINAHQKTEGKQKVTYNKGAYVGRLSRLEALKAFARFDFIHMNGVCIRRECFLSLGGFPISYYHGDGDIYFWLKILCELEAIHYDDTVTSLQIIELNNVSYEKFRIIDLHAGLNILKDCELKLTREERRQLLVAINRKVLSYAIERKNLGQPIRLDLETLTMRGMSVRLCLHAISLLMPQPYYDQLRNRVKLI